MSRGSFVLTGLLSIGHCSDALFAQPILDRVEQLLRDQVGAARSAEGRQAGETAEPGYLGLVADDRPQAGRGVTVVTIVADGPAAKAGLQPGDSIKSIDGKLIGTTDDVAQAIEGKRPGTKLAIRVQRGGIEREHSVTLGQRVRRSPPGKAPEGNPATDASTATVPQPAAPQRLGVRTLEVSEEARRQNNLSDAQGAMVISIAPGSPADRAGISVGAVITSIGQRAVRSPQDLAAAVRAAQPGEIELAYVHQGTHGRTTVSLPAATATNQLKPQTRARPVERSAGPRPGDLQAPAIGAEARVAALEARIHELEERIKKLEARLPQPEGSPPGGEASKPE